jgi:hypothetical protein
MNFIEQNAFFIVGIFGFLFVFLMISFSYREVQLMLRQFISYKSFQQKRQYFFGNKNPSHIVLSWFLIFLSVILNFLFFSSNYLRIYTWGFTFIILLLIFFTFQEYKIKKTKLNIDTFQDYYDEISHLIQKKDELGKALTVLNKDLSDSEELIQHHISRFNEWLKQPLDENYNLVHTEKLHTRFDNYRKELNKYSDSIIDSFNALLRSYVITQQQQSQLDIPSLRGFSIEESKQDIAMIESVFKETTYKLISTWLQTNGIKKHNYIISLVQYVVEWKKDHTHLFNYILNYFSQFHEGEEWLEYLIKNHREWLQSRLIERDCIENFSWVYQEITIAILSKDKVYEVLKTTINANIYSTAFMLGSNLPNEYIDLLLRLEQVITTNNETKELLRVFESMKNNHHHFSDDSKRHFDMLQSIIDNSDLPTYPLPSILEQIKDEDNLIPHREIIEEFYQRSQSHLMPIKNSVLKVMLDLKRIIPSDEWLINERETLIFSNELFVTLQYSRMTNLLMVLLYLYVKHIQDEPAVINYISSINAPVQDLLNNRMKSKVPLSKVLDSFLINPERRLDTSSIIYRIERNRLSFQLIFKE